MSDELVQVWRERDGSWRWRYVMLDHTELRSNRGYESAEEAVRSARQAFPGVSVLGPIDEAPIMNGHPRRGASVVRTAAISASAVFIALAAWYAINRLGRLGGRARRWRRNPLIRAYRLGRVVQRRLPVGR